MAPEKDLGQAGWSVLVMIFGYADLRFPATILRYDPRVTETERAAAQLHPAGLVLQPEGGFCCRFAVFSERRKME
jgi:hypothetical protein